MSQWSGSFHVIQRDFDREEREFYSLNVRADPSSMNLLDGYAIVSARGTPHHLTLSHLSCTN